MKWIEYLDDPKSICFGCHHWDFEIEQVLPHKFPAEAKFANICMIDCDNVGYRMQCERFKKAEPALELAE